MVKKAKHLGITLGKAPVLGKAVTPKEVLGKVTKPNLKNIGKSIKPTVRSKPYGKV
jgi:hypothetical protein